MSRLIRCLASLVLFAALHLTSAQVDLQEERLLLTFVPNVQFSPFYIGIETGLFAEAGFDISLEHLQEPEVLDLVALGQARFGVVSGEQVILARAQARDVVYVFEWFQQYPVGLVLDNARDLTDLADLRGLTVGIPGRFGASYSGLAALLGSAGLSEADIEVSEIGFSAPEVFCLGGVDAASVYVNNEPLQIQKLADAGDCGEVEEVRVITVASRVDLVSNGLIVSRALIEGEPDAVARMVAALSDALAAAIDNPAAAYLVSLDYVDNLPADDALVAALEAEAERQAQFLESKPDRASVAESRAALLERMSGMLGESDLTQLRVLLATIALWDGDRLGYSDGDSWEAMRHTLARIGMLEADEQDLSAAFSNSFLPEPGA